ncbi:MAG: hypothetical protein ABI992_08320 [Chthoniobacterales bacterium]
MEEFRRNLLQRIQQRISLRGFCVVYNNDLSQLSKPLEELRAQQVRDIQRFARSHGLSVEIRDIGLNATFRLLPTKASATSTAEPIARV